MKKVVLRKDGFTLIEVLIVLIVFAIISAAVAFSIVGVVRKGANHAYEADIKNIQLAASAFYSDLHAGFDVIANTWMNKDEADAQGHSYPTAIGNPAGHYLTRITNTVDDYGSPMLYDSVDCMPADRYDVSMHSIWMGLLVHLPNQAPLLEGGLDGTVLRDRFEAVSPLHGEYGGYLQEIPESAGVENGSTESGQYTWIIDNTGTVLGVYIRTNYDPPGPMGIGDYWFAGFNGSYP